MEAQRTSLQSDVAVAPFDAIVVVSSAGGLEAISRILTDLPAGLPTPVIVMQHLSGQASGLVDILRRRTSLQVKWIQDGDALKPGHVHVAPPRRRLEVLPDRTCALSQERSRPVDLVLDELLQSAADSLGPRVVTVVLTGMGRDAAKGALSVKQAGGTVIVQREDTAEQPAMPRAAINAGAASLVVPLQELAGLITKLVRGEPLPRSNEEVDALHATFGEKGDIAALAREINWSQTPLGPVHQWPLHMRTIIRVAIDSPDATMVLWGRDHLSFFNEAALATIGERCATAFGRPYREVFSESWPTLHAQLAEIERRDESLKSFLKPYSGERSGQPVQYWLDISQTPVRGPDGSIIAVRITFFDRTQEVLASRRLEAVNRLAAAEIATNQREALERAFTLLHDSADIPFAIAYLIETSRKQATLVAAYGADTGGAMAPRQLATDSYHGDWPLVQVIDRGQPVIVNDLATRFRGHRVGPLPLTLESAVMHPLRDAAERRVIGALVLGTDPRLTLDERYREFLTLVGDTISSKVADAHARQRERERLERLAELDRAKTEFFSNVSHEFRTPLTLMLAPLDELQLRRRELPDHIGDELAMAAANARRLLTLVDTLLDFSQIEAGRLRAQFEATDLAPLTADIAAVFRSAADRAGVRYSVDCPPMREPVWIDPAMWEKIVSNLISNALKFTVEGEIAIRLNEQPGHAELVVSDTGVGIPDAEQSHIFKRFHRVRAPRARTHEGSGIGLAIVYELVRLHHGRVRVRSAEGKGSTFTIWIPLGKRVTHDGPPRHRTSATAVPHIAATLAREAERWNVAPTVPDDVLDEPLGQPAPPLPAHATGARILVVDDNADMREYLRRLLSERWTADVAADGEQALNALRAHKPDLVLADVMMPNLDGFALLRAVRRDERLKHTPVVLVTARAGEEAAIEGLIAGADDYIAKPFSARELLARVGGQLELSRMRRRAAETNDFLLRFSDAARPLAAPQAIARMGLRMLAEHLSVDGTHWAEVDWTTREYVVEDAYQLDSIDVGGAPHGRSALEAYEPKTSMYLAGRSIVTDDARIDEQMPEAIKTATVASGRLAQISVPVMVEGQLRAVLSVNQSSPRLWTPEEVLLVESVAGRCWAEVERARAQAELLARNEELERFSKVTVGRETRIIELKQQVNALLERVGEPPRYRLAFEDADEKGDA